MKRWIFHTLVWFSSILDLLSNIHYYCAIRRVGKKTFLSRGLRINHPEFVTIGSRTYINESCWISILKTNCEKGSATLPLSPNVCIGDNTYIGRFCTIACMDEILIGNNVLISDRVYFGDCNHGFARTDIPIKDQYMFSPGTISVGDGAWIGVGVSVMPNVKIGNNCVVGANSVVTQDIPDYHIAVGAPARIIKRVSGEIYNAQ